MITDLNNIIRWYFIISLLGLFALPLSLITFKKLQDKGFIFSKIIAILFLSYFVWLLGSIKLLPFGQLAIFLILTIFIGLNGLILWKNKFLLSNFPGKIFLLEEILFLSGLVFWSFVRATNPEIRGLEKFMDFGFVNSILRTKFFPPMDMWLTPLPINYYYFGHTITAVLTTLTKIDSAITYNLMLGTLFAFCFTATFSLTYNISSCIKIKEKIIGQELAIFGGLIGALLNTLGGNLHTLVYVIKNGADRYWYPDATRYVSYTIHEFPMYSFIVSDLHGHVLDIPTVLLILTLILSYLLSGKNVILAFIGWILGISYMTNAWNLPIYLLISLLALIVYHQFKQNNNEMSEMIKMIISKFILILTISIITALPFHLSFKQIAKGVALVEAHSPLYQLLILWGFPLFVTFSFGLFLWREKITQIFKGEKLISKAAALLNVPIEILKNKREKLKNKLIYIDWLIIILLAVSWLLVMFPEIFYVKDIYIKEYHRANTMFKFVYQSFMMFSIAGGYIFIRFLSSEKRNIVFMIIYIFLFSSVMTYPYFAIKSYYNSLKEYKGLAGSRFWQNVQPDDYEAILWIKNNIKGQPTILEAVGESYTDYSRMSAFTGLPTVLGWPVHEWLWRGSYEEAGKRTAEVAKMYESENLTEIFNLLRRYNVRYVIIGNLEREKYKNIKEKNFTKLGRLEIDFGQTKIYKIH